MPTRSVALLSLAVTLLVACGDSSGESSSAAPRISRGEPTAPFIDEVDGQTRVRCDVTFQAHARRQFSWQGARVRFFPGHGTVAFDSLDFDWTEVSDAFGGGTVGDGETAQSGWYFFSPVPFTAEMDFRYQAEGDDGVDVVPTGGFYCGPEVPDNAAPLVITKLIATDTGPMQPFDIFHMQAAVTAPAGTWQEIYELSGGCDTTYYGSVPLLPGFDRTLFLRLPTVCAGGPIEVRFTAIDAALNMQQFELSTGVVVASLRAGSPSPGRPSVGQLPLVLRGGAGVTER